jgi:hypothetical protein
MRQTGIFASNTKLCITKNTAYEKGKLKEKDRYLRPEQKKFLTKQTTSIMDNISKTNNLSNFSNNLITNN